MLDIGVLGFIDIIGAFFVNMMLSYAFFRVAAEIMQKSPDRQEVSDYPIMRSEKAIPKKIVYGTDRVAGELIWMGEPTAYFNDESSAIYWTRSFLLYVCEGPANVIRIWEGDNLVYPVRVSSSGRTNRKMVNNQYPDRFVLFNGVDNSGIQTLTGEDYGQYKYDCCVFFRDYQLGTSKNIPNFVFEVSSGAGGIFCGLLWWWFRLCSC